MEVSQRLFINHVVYNHDKTVTIGVIPQLVDGQSKVVGSAPIEWVNTREESMIALGAQNGRTDGEWGNREVEQTIFAQEELVTAAANDTPAVTKRRFEAQPIVHSY